MKREPLPAGTPVIVDARGHLHLTSQDGRKQASNTRAARHGRDNEEWIDAINARCFAEGIAYVHRVSTPFRTISNDGARFTAVRSAKQGCDFRGVMLDGSKREVRVEAKALAENRWFPLKEIRDSQRADLERCDRSGGVAVLLLSVGPKRDLWAYSWRTIRGLIESGYKRIQPVCGNIAPGECYLARWVE